jgi:hypothetical protein
MEFEFLDLPCTKQVQLLISIHIHSKFWLLPTSSFVGFQEDIEQFIPQEETSLKCKGLITPLGIIHSDNVQHSVKHKLDFTAIFWIAKYLHRPIYIWNNVSKHIMFRCGMEFESIPLHISYRSQHFEPIQYVNGLFKSLFTFQIIDPKVMIDLDDFPSPLELVVQQPLIQLSQLATSFYWNENLNYA